jgi:Zn ribbon nucleic-acid-binding protein
MLAPRKCVDCGHHWTPTDTGPWLDHLECPQCGSDDTIGEVLTLSLEDELALLAGEAA